MGIKLDNLNWNLVEGKNLVERISNKELKEKLSNISENIYFATTKTTIYFKRKDGRTIAQPKNNSRPFCVDCVNSIGYKSPANYYTGEDFVSEKK